MPRIARKESRSNFYHVMSQGINKEYIFNKEEDMKNYQRLIKEKLKNANIIILAYCIMNNHVHFLIYCENEVYLSKYMQRLNTSYGRLYNKKNERVGYVFRDRFRSQDILDQRQLYNCLRYIHNNPVKAGMVKNISEYQYSSYNEFLKEKDIITDESIKILFGNNKDYKIQFKLIHNNCEDEDDFIDENEKVQDISCFIREFEKNYNRKIEELSQDRDLLKIAINDARHKTNVTIVELAEKLNLSKSTVARYTKKS